jgi:gephyrin
MSAPKLQAAILIISDTASKDGSTDKSGPVLKDVFSQDGGDRWGEPIVKIVPDSILDIQRSVQQWSDHDNYVNLIVTTGGTGFATKDYTPEAISPLIHRHAPGIVHGMLAASFQVTPFAMMSRPVAGVRNKTIIITLPGSPKGAKENLQAVLKLLPHACQQAAGEDSRTAHVGGVKKLEKDAGVAVGETGTSTTASHTHSHSHSHNHSHGHTGHKVPKAHTNPSERPPQSNDPTLGATHRARSSPYPMLSVSAAVTKILSVTPFPTATVEPLIPKLTGSTLAADIHAVEAVPAYRASIVDGYAVTLSEDRSIKGTFPVASISHAAATANPPPLESGTIARITTGAPLPPNANAVVMVEDTVVASTTSDGSEEASVTILTDQITKGENIREPGSDIALNSLVLKHGQRIGSVGGEIGLLAASGTRNVPIYRKPRVGILSTGDEVTDILTSNAPLTGGQIRDSNRPSLLSLLASWNLCASVIDLGIARDTPPGELERIIRDGFRTHNIDVLITTGGVSMGELDLLKPTLERNMGGTVHFGRVAMKPGKPTTFASVPFKPSSSSEPNMQTNTQSERIEKLVFGLPGNPASALVTAHLFVLPCLQKLAGVPVEECGMERVMVRVSERVRCDAARVEYHRVVVSCGRDGVLVARSTGMQRSSRVGSLSSANALLVLPQKDGVLEARELCEALMMGPIVGFGT